MKSRKSLYLTGFLLLLMSVCANAQERQQLVTLADSLLQKGSLAQAPVKDKDAAKVDSLHKTLDTYLFGSWHKPLYVFSWQHNPYFNTLEKRLTVDTLINSDLPDFPFFKNDVGASFVGTSGGAILTQDYFKRSTSNELLFYRPYNSYTFTPSSLPFFNAKGPFTILSYHSSGQKKIAENDLKVLFTQNLSPEWNIGLYYQRYGTQGVYQNQATENRTFSLFTSYAGKRYTAHAGYIYNGVGNEENGGIKRDSDVTDTVIDAEIIEVNLLQASNKLRSNLYFLSQTYGVPLHLFNRSDSVKTGEGTMVYFGHAFEYRRQSRLYKDSLNSTVTYYQHSYISPTGSSDSTFNSSLDNRLFIRLQPWSPTAIVSTIDGGVGLDFTHYYGFAPSQFLLGESASSFTDMYAYARASGSFSRYFAWNGFGRYYLSGYRQNDMLIDASARISLYPFSKQLNFTGRLMLQSTEPNLFEQNYYSNHFKWNNTFDKTTETRLEASISMPDYALEAGLKQSLVSNLVYMKSDTMPAQESGAVSITSLYLQKNFTLGAFHADNRLLFQLCNNQEVMPLPKLSFNATWYVQMPLVKSVLTGQLGLDVFYNGKYYLPGYNPATGMFYNQREKEVGGYPMVDVFLNFKWKRATIFVKLSHADYGMFNKEYFSALHYPRNPRMLRLGVSWHFYN